MENFTFTRHKFLLVTVKEWLKSVLNYRSYPKNKTVYPFFDHPVVVNLQQVAYMNLALSTWILRSLTGQWAARVCHLLLFVATARTLLLSTPRSTRSSLNVDHQIFVGRPRRLLLPRGVHDMASLAGRPGGILMICPAIRSRLSATMFCNLRCPVWLSTSMLVTLSFHVMPRIFLYTGKP